MVDAKLMVKVKSTLILSTEECNTTSKILCVQQI